LIQNNAATSARLHCAGMIEQALGRLEPVDLRDIWVSEATSFTPWLARPDRDHHPRDW
jgi:hypothetical protein